MLLLRIVELRDPLVYSRYPFRRTNIFLLKFMKVMKLPRKIIPPKKNAVNIIAPAV
jgi:hypothetical protein